MSPSCRLLGLLALVAAATSAPLEHQMAGPSAVEDQLPAASLVWPGIAPVERSARLSVEEGETSSQPENVQVSVSTSTSVEIASVTTSVSSEMEPLPEVADRPQEGEQQATETEEAPGAELEAGQVPLEKAIDEEDKQSESFTGAEAEEELKAAASPTSPTSTEEEATSVAPVMTKVETNVSAEEGQDSSAEQTTSASQVAATTEVVAEEKTQDSEEEKKEAEEEVEMEKEGSEAAGGASGAEGADAEGSGAGQPTDTGANVPPETTTVDVNTTKGTLIFDLGPSASDELHDLVQQTVLDALMDEGLLSAVTDADSAPVIEAEGSGIVFLDESGSGEGEGEVESDVGQGRSSPFVSIHF